jgi:POT family proton-dependent oligopeptide transporter
MFYLGLVFIVCGTGLLKGNVSVIVGRLYAAKDGRRDAAFSIFYMGINLGAATAPFITGWLGQNINWHLGFAAAGVGMVLGLIQYLTRSKYLGDAGLHPSPAASPEAAEKLRRTARLVAGALVIVIVVLGVGGYSGVISLSATQVADAGGWFLLLVTLGFFGWLYFVADWTHEERKKLYVVGVLFIASALFWSVFEQAGSTLNLFADRNTRNVVFGFEYPSSWYQSMNACFIFMFAAVFAWIWITLSKAGKEPSSAAKFSIGLVFAGLGFAILVPAAELSAEASRVSPLWLVGTYLMHTFGELSLSPVGLSAMTRLAPARIGGLMMGVWFLATAVGNYAGGRVAGLYESFPLPTLFTTVAVFAIAAGLVLALFVKPIGRMLGERH